MQPTTMQFRPTILVVEDDVLILAMTGEALEDAGFDPVCVSSAEDALGLAIMDVAFDALFTDINLDGVLDGFDLAGILREMRPGIPVLYTSGDACNDVAARRVADSMFIAKPYNLVAVCELMKGIAAARRTVVSQPVRAVSNAGPEARKAELRLIA